MDITFFCLSPYILLVVRNVAFNALYSSKAISYLLWMGYQTSVGLSGSIISLTKGSSGRFLIVDYLPSLELKMDMNGARIVFEAIVRER